MLDHQHGAAVAIAHAFDHRPHRHALLRGEAGHRLVEQQQLRVAGQCAREIDRLALAVRQGLDRLFGDVGETQRLQQRFDQLGLERPLGAEHPAQALRRRQFAAHVRAELDDVHHRQVVERGDVLERAHDAAPNQCVRCQPDQLFALPDDAAGAGPIGAGDAIDERRLARAVRPDQADDLARRDAEAHRIDRDHTTEVDGHAFSRQCHRSPFC